MGATPPPNVYRTMTEIAKEALKEAILNGVYGPGTRLIPAKLEKELNLGRVAIREAIKELTGSGLVVSVPNKGAVVSTAISVEEMREVFEIRFDLEGKAAQIATQRISDEEIAKLEELNKDLRGYVDNSRQYFLLNRKFHLDFYRSSGWDFLCQIITQLFDRVVVFRSVYPFSEDDIKMYIEEHVAMLKAMRARDTALIRELIVAHLRTSLENLMACSGQYQVPLKK